MKPKHISGLSRATIALAISIGSCVSTANAQGELGAFATRPSYNNVPDLANPGSFASHIVFYNLPSSSSIYAGPSGGFFDLTARVSGDGTMGAAGFGLRALLDGNGEVVFNPAPISGGTNPPNNIPYSLNPGFTQNSALDIMYGVINVQGGGNRSLGIVALNDLAATNVTITNGDGLAAVPMSIADGAQGLFHVTFENDPTYTGFTNAAGQVVTDPAQFPHQTGLIEIRRSIPGDMNGDGAVNQGDVGLFMSAITDPNGFKQQYPWLQTDYIADFNEDRLININDLPGFQQAVIPEPATVLTAIIGALIGVRIHRRRRAM
jgi:hypothetical protein